MTREEAIAVLQKIKPTPCRADGKSTTHTLETIALDMAIKALKGADLDGYSSRLWKAAYERGKAEAEQASALDKIKAKLIEEKECAYADFERYKVEYLGQDWSDVYDSLPQDDFRYGLERCIEIIDKYKAGSEDKA